MYSNYTYYQPFVLFWCQQSSRALEILQEINLSVHRKSKLSEVALQKIQDNSLSLKYSLTGHLPPTDITTDGFYDPGQVQMKMLSKIFNARGSTNQ